MEIKGTIDQERGKGRGGPACGTKDCPIFEVSTWMSACVV